MTFPLPVILCGKIENIIVAVIEALLPEIEGKFILLLLIRQSMKLLLICVVVHVILSPEAGKVQIPLLLRGDKTFPSGFDLGSKNYEVLPAAILLGAAYDDEAVKEMREAAKDTKSVPWIRTDTTKPAPPLGPEYGRALVVRIKETVKELQENKRMDEDAVVWS